MKPGPVLLAAAVELKDAGKLTNGDRRPRDVVAPPQGSRGDIEARGVRDRERWTLKVRRARETADKEHDVQFGDALRALALGLALAAGPAEGAETPLVAPAVPAARAPAVDGKVDAVWAAAKPARLTLAEGSQGTVEVTARALRTDTHLYLLFEWPDRTQSLNRVWEFASGGWRAARGSEDRLNLAWPIGGAAPDFAARGCQGACHKSEGVMRTGGPGERIDLWYWMAQRTNPLGVADNWVLTHEVAPVGGVRTGRRPDVPAGNPWEPNWDEAAGRPRQTFRPGARPGPVLLRPEAVPVRPAARFKAGDRVPREVLQPPQGPRAAIEARGVWERGTWRVELRRALLTASDADVQFAGPGPHYLAVSIHDDAERDEHAHMGRDVVSLRFEASPAVFHLADGSRLEVAEWIRHGDEYVVTLPSGETRILRQSEVRSVEERPR